MNIFKYFTYSWGLITTSHSFDNGVQRGIETKDFAIEFYSLSDYLNWEIINELNQNLLRLFCVLMQQTDNSEVISVGEVQFT